MMRTRGSALVIATVLLLAVSPAPCVASGSQQVPVGPRPISMGGAFTSVVDDATAIFWNPAGLSRIGHQEVTVSHANLYQSGIKDDYVAFLLPLAEKHAVAVDWYHSGFDDGELGFAENRFDLSYSWRLLSSVSVGANLKYLMRNTDLDGSSVRQGSGQGLDVGILLTPWRGLRMGLVGQDLLDTELDYSDVGSSVAYPRNVRTAFSYEFGNLASLGLDLDDRYHLGAEARPWKPLSLRAGMEKDRSGAEKATYSAGAGFELGVLRIDYAYVMPPVLEPTSYIGLSAAFSFNPSQIRIEKVEAEDVFASLYRSYAKAPIGTARIRNLQDRPLSAKITTFIPGIMEAPSEEQIQLRPKVTQDVPLHAVLSDRVLGQAGDRPMQMQVTATYQSQRLPRTDKKSQACVVYGPGAIDWGRGVAQAAAFVTTRDPAVEGLAQEVARSVVLTGSDILGNRNLRFAAAFFDALGVLGVAYVPDPQNPYASVSETPRAVDTVHYPRETLARRTGDCDDTSVLMAALLGNVGVSTKLVDVPGHLFLLVDTGLHERNRLALGVDSSLYAVVDEGVWIPLETTALGKPFPEAWRTGAEEFRSWSSRGRLELVDVALAQEQYAPGQLPGATPQVTSLDAAEVGSWVARDAQTLDAWRSEYLATRYGAVRENMAASPQALNELAHIYFLAGDDARAKAKLEEMLRQDTQSATAHNNLGNVLTTSGEMGKAVEHYRSALGADPADAGIWLNLGLVYYAAGDTLDAREPLDRGLSRAGGYREACRLLGLDVGAVPVRGAEEKLTAEEARSLLQEALARVPSARAESDTSRFAEPDRFPAPAQPMQTRTAASRAAERMALREHLYWKE